MRWLIFAVVIDDDSFAFLENIDYYLWEEGWPQHCSRWSHWHGIMGCTIAPAEASGGIASTGVSVGLIQAHSHGAPHHTRRCLECYSKKRW